MCHNVPRPMNNVGGLPSSATLPPTHPKKRTPPTPLHLPALFPKSGANQTNPPTHPPTHPQTPPPPGYSINQSLSYGLVQMSDSVSFCCHMQFPHFMASLYMFQPSLPAPSRLPKPATPFNCFACPLFLYLNTSIAQSDAPAKVHGRAFLELLNTKGRGLGGAKTPPPLPQTPSPPPFQLSKCSVLWFMTVHTYWGSPLHCGGPNLLSPLSLLSTLPTLC